MNRRVKQVAIDMIQEKQRAQGINMFESYTSGAKPISPGGIYESLNAFDLESSETTDEDEEFNKATEKMYYEITASPNYLMVREDIIEPKTALSYREVKINSSIVESENKSLAIP